MDINLVNKNTKHFLPYIFLFAIALLSLAFKLSVFGAGSPYVTIDDYTLYEAGFLVWFGEAPPQRMYFESWLVGFSSIGTYIIQLLLHGDLDQLGLNLVADAYRAFTKNPDAFVKSYRHLMLAIDFSTAWLVFLLAKNIFSEHFNARWLAVIAASMFLLSYNTIWCYIVARPDTVTAFFSALGMLYYYKSNVGERKKDFYISALALGCATGFKLHAALFIVFLIADMIRQLGFVIAVKRSLPFGIISVFIFAVTAGSPLFDPLLYAKLRALNIKDDESPWLVWGDQIITAIRGIGWIAAPMLFIAGFLVLTRRIKNVPQPIISIIFISLLFFLFFLSIRQLRAYWMLPALPLFYITTVYLLSQIKNKIFLATLLTGIFITLATQCFLQSKEFDNARYGELKEWIQDNVKSDEAIYIIGYNTLFLPCNTTCLENRKFSLEHRLNTAINAGETFTLRHIRQWEERAQLQLINMLDVRSTEGFNFYSINGTPLDTLQGRIEFKDIQYVLVMQGYISPESKKLIEKVHQEFTLVTTANAPGGKAGTGGLPYDIYMRNSR